MDNEFSLLFCYTDGSNVLFFFETTWSIESLRISFLKLVFNRTQHRLGVRLAAFQQLTGVFCYVQSNLDFHHFLFL